MACTTTPAALSPARAEVLAKIRLHGDYGEYCIDLLGRAMQAGFRLVEVPYICVPRTAGESKTGANLWDYLVKGRKYVAAVWLFRGQSSGRNLTIRIIGAMMRTFASSLEEMQRIL